MDNQVIKNKIKNLEEKILKSIYEKYGLFPNEYIMVLLKEELKAVNKGRRKEEVKILYDFVSWLKEEKIPYWLRGTAGSSLLLYTIGITSGNPLPAHSICPECKTLNWLDNNYYSGFDVKEILKCEKDGYILLTDGHNIPWQSLWGYDDSEIIFTIDLPIKSYCKIREFWEVYQFDIFKRGLLETRKEFKNIRFSNIDCVFTIEDANPNFYNVDLDIDKTLKSFDIDDLPDAYKFSDLLYGIGLKNSTGAWNEKTRFMIENLYMNLSDMIAFREDIFFLLIGNFTCVEEAWLETKNFNKGKRFWKGREEMLLSPDKWKIAICEDIKYLFPKAHCLEYLIFKMKNKEV